MENSLSYVIFCWFFATTAHQQMTLVKTKISLKIVSDFSAQYIFIEKIQKKKCYLNYVRRGIAQRVVMKYKLHLDEVGSNLNVEK